MRLNCSVLALCLACCLRFVGLGFDQQCGCGCGEVGASADGGDVQVGLGCDGLDPGAGAAGCCGPGCGHDGTSKAVEQHRHDGCAVGDFGDDADFDSAGEDVVDECAHQRAALGDDESASGEVVARNVVVGGPVVVGSGDQHEGLTFQRYHVEVCCLCGLGGSEDTDLGGSGSN